MLITPSDYPWCVIRKSLSLHWGRVYLSWRTCETIGRPWSCDPGGRRKRSGMFIFVWNQIFATQIEILPNMSPQISQILISTTGIPKLTKQTCVGGEKGSVYRRVNSQWMCLESSNSTKAGQGSQRSFCEKLHSRCGQEVVGGGLMEGGGS